ncbi:MAG: PEGA domain-containing protein, partial [Caulobacteraceae bacterium]
MNTVPNGAAVTTSLGFRCAETPCTFRIHHNAKFDVTITKAGYETWHGHVTHAVSSGGSLG